MSRATVNNDLSEPSKIINKVSGRHAEHEFEAGSTDDPYVPDNSQWNDEVVEIDRSKNTLLIFPHCKSSSDKFNLRVATFLSADSSGLNESQAHPTLTQISVPLAGLSKSFEYVERPDNHFDKGDLQAVDDMVSEDLRDLEYTGQTEKDVCVQDSRKWTLKHCLTKKGFETAVSENDGKEHTRSKFFGDHYVLLGGRTTSTGARLIERVGAELASRSEYERAGRSFESLADSQRRLALAGQTDVAKCDHAFGLCADETQFSACHQMTLAHLRETDPSAASKLYNDIVGSQLRDMATQLDNKIFTDYPVFYCPTAEQEAYMSITDRLAV